MLREKAEETDSLPEELIDKLRGIL